MVDESNDFKYDYDEFFTSENVSPFDKRFHL